MAGGSTSALLRRTAKNVRSAPRQWADDSVKRLSQAAKGTLAGDTGDGTISGAGMRLKVETKVQGDSFVQAEVVAGPSRSRAGWFWMEEGTGPYRPQGGRSPAKRTWSRAVDPLMPAIEQSAAGFFAKAVSG